MSKLLKVLFASVLLVALLSSGSLADDRTLKPAADQIPQPADLGGFGWDSFWIELDPREGGSGSELPQGDDFIRGGPVAGGFQHGIPMGFNFKYMQGPEMGTPIYGWIDPDGIPDNGDEYWGVVAWDAALSNDGYTELFVSLNGYVIFDPIYHAGARPSGDWTGLGTWAWSPEELPDPGVPNNFVAPYFTDLTITDNSFLDVKSVAFKCTGQWTEGASLATCPASTVGNVVASPAGCVCAAGPGLCTTPVTGFWTPCTTARIQRPRGKLLYKTIGEVEGERIFVVQWSYAKNAWTGNLATFQVQLWEGSNGILFLFKEFTTKAFYEDPPHADAYFVNPGLLVGMEDWYGQTGVGQLYLADYAAPFGPWQLFNPALNALGFVPDAYAGIRPFF